LTDDGVHPNDSGQQIYFETISSVIDSAVESNRGFDTSGKEPLNEGVTAFDTYRYISSNEFNRSDDVTYTLDISISGIMGIDYTYQSGENNTEIWVDDELFAAPTVTFDYDFSQRHILIVSDDCEVKKTIKIVFENKDQADEFYGLYFSDIE
jgi:hypothetical protein